jgi:signal-transduction protein with cAMP-binding, CBS, and nucleotidyltransferase domain
MGKLAKLTSIMVYILRWLIRFYCEDMFMLDRDAPEVVKTYMTKGLLTIDKDKMVFDAAKIMSKLDIGSLLVTDNDTPVGLLTEGDIISKVVAKGLRSESVKIFEVMSSPFASIDVNQSVATALMVMGEKGTNHLVVMDKEEAVGMFSLVNIVNLESYRLDIK